jgi:predicted acyl esterase
VIDLPNTSLTFLAGHRLRIDISSSNYPKYNRNMNNGNNMYPGNSTDSLLNPLVANNIVYLNANKMSSVELPLSNFSKPYSINAVKKATSFCMDRS